MKIRGTIADFLVLADGRQRITFETKDDFRNEYERLREKEIAIEPKVYRKPRSLDANAYFHVLVNKIAVVIGSSDDEVKRELVVKYGTIETDEDGNAVGAMLPVGIDVGKYYPYARCYKNMELNGREYRCYLFYKHTRDMDSKEMSHLIDGTVSEAKQLDIETMTPDQIAQLEGLEPCK